MARAKKTRRKMSSRTLLLIPVGVAMNLVISNVLSVFGVIAGDSAGTILVGALCGSGPGAVVGLLSNTVNIVRNPLAIVFSIFNIAFGLIAAALVRRGMYRTLPKALLTAPIYAFVGGTVGTVLTWFALKGEFFPTVANAVISIPLWHAGVPKFIAMTTGSTTFDLLDKLLMVSLAFIIIRKLPARFLSKMPNGKYVLPEITPVAKSAKADRNPVVAAK